MFTRPSVWSPTLGEQTVTIPWPLRHRHLHLSCKHAPPCCFWALWGRGSLELKCKPEFQLHWALNLPALPCLRIHWDWILYPFSHWQKSQRSLYNNSVWMGLDLHAFSYAADGNLHTLWRAPCQYLSKFRMLPCFPFQQWFLSTCHYTGKVTLMPRYPLYTVHNIRRICINQSTRNWLK